MMHNLKKILPSSEVEISTLKKSTFKGTLSLISSRNDFKRVSLVELIEISLKEYHPQREYLVGFLEIGKTYEALEFANLLYKHSEIDETLLTKIAHKHYLKISSSPLKDKVKYQNQMIMKYPMLEYLR